MRFKNFDENSYYALKIHWKLHLNSIKWLVSRATHQTPTFKPQLDTPKISTTDQKPSKRKGNENWGSIKNVDTIPGRSGSSRFRPSSSNVILDLSSDSRSLVKSSGCSRRCLKCRNINEKYDTHFEILRLPIF